MFADRAEAGRRLAAALAAHLRREPGHERSARDGIVVLALPRGGVPVAAEVARALGAPLDLLMVRKIGLPTQPELAMGAVVDGAHPLVVRNEGIIREAHVGREAFEAACRSELTEIERRRRAYVGDRPPLPVKGRLAIIIDDGIATGATVRVAVAALRDAGAGRIVIATPVAASSTVEMLEALADEVVCLEAPRLLHAVGYHYRDFGQVPDADVIALMAAADARSPAPAPTTADGDARPRPH